MGSRGGYSQRTRWLHCASRWAWDSEASNATSRSGIWTPTLPGALISRHAIRTAPSDEARRYVCPTSRQARLYCDRFEQCGRGLDALFASSRRMKELSEPPTGEILEASWAEPNECRQTNAATRQRSKRCRIAACLVWPAENVFIKVAVLRTRVCFPELLSCRSRSPERDGSH